MIHSFSGKSETNNCSRKPASTLRISAKRNLMHTHFFLRLIATVIVAIGLLLVVGSFLPRDYSFQTEMKFAASPDEIFPYVNNLKAWQEWSSYSSDINPQLELTLGPIEEGVDASQSWVETRGSGKLWITHSIPNEQIAYIVEFGNFPAMKSTMELVPDGEETLVKWSSQGRLPGGPFYGWFGRYFSEILVADYRSSLERLKRIVERQRPE